MCKSEAHEAALRELREWPGVTAVVEPGRKHVRVILHYDGRSRFVVRSSTLSDHRGVRNHVGDIKRTLRLMGAERKG